MSKKLGNERPKPDFACSATEEMRVLTPLADKLLRLREMTVAYPIYVCLCRRYTTAGPTSTKISLYEPQSVH